MKKLSPASAAIVEKLRVRNGWFTRPKESVKAEHVARIAGIGEPAAILPLFPHLFDRLPEVVAAVGDAITELITKCSGDDLLDLDEQARWSTEWDIGPQWMKLKPQQVAELGQATEISSAVLGLASFHFSGYVREEAVRRLSKSASELAIPFLLIRCNDWVDSVRHLATTAVEERVQADAFDFSERNLYLLFRLLDCQRSDHLSLAEHVVERLVQQSHQSIMFALVNSQNRLVRRVALRLGADTQGSHLSPLLTAGAAAEDPVIRLWAVRKAAVIWGEPELSFFLTSVENDRFLPIRREVLRIRLERHPRQAEDHLRTALSDPSPSLREEARFFLRKQGVTEFVGVYRSLLAARSHPEIAIAGIGETGAKEDAPLVAPFLHSSRSRVRKAAVTALGRLAAVDYLDQLRHRLSDESPKVTREASKQLSRQVHGLELESLWNVYEHDDRLHVKISILRLINELSTWRKLPFLIRAATAPAPSIAEFARSLTASMFNRVFTRPSPIEKQAIFEALAQSRGQLPPGFLKQVSAWVNSLAP